QNCCSGRRTVALPTRGAAAPSRPRTGAGRARIFSWESPVNERAGGLPPAVFSYFDFSRTAWSGPTSGTFSPLTVRWVECQVNESALRGGNVVVAVTLSPSPL